MTSTTDRRVQLQKFGKHRVGVLGAAVVAASVVAFGSAGIAHAYTVVNNTGYDVLYGSYTDWTAPTLPNGASLSYGNSGTADFYMWENAQYKAADPRYAAAQWTVTWGLNAKGAKFAQGEGTGAGTFLHQGGPQMGYDTPQIATLTLGGTENRPGPYGPIAGANDPSFNFDPNKVVTCYNCPGPESFVPTYFDSVPPIRTRGAIIVVNEKPMKIWNPRTNPLRGVAAKPTAPVSSVAAVSPVSSTLSAQQQSVAKTATPHRAAARRAAVTASRSAPLA